MRAWEFITEAEWDPSGWGNTPYGTDIDYFGIRVKMRPSTFLKLAAPLDRTQMNPDVKKHMAGGGKIAYPMLEVKIPEGWEDGDLHDYATVASHEGRNRVTNWIEMHGDDPIQVNIIGRGGMRRRHFTPEIIERLSQGMHGERGRMFVRGPLFDVNTVLEEGVTEGFDKEAGAWRDWQIANLDRKMKMLSRLVNGWLPSEEDHHTAIEAGYLAMKKTGDVNDAAKAISDTFKEIQRRQGVAEDTVDEMALKSYTPLGKFDKPGPFKDPDYKLVVHPKHIEKVTTFFERVPQDFRMFMSNLPGKTKYRESGEKTPEEIKQIFGDKIAAEILKDTDDTITIIYMGNYGLNRQIMNSWQIAHRVGHAITATGRYNRDKEIIEWRALDQYFFNQLNNMLQRYYGVETRGWSPEHRQQLNKQREALIYQLGVQRSSRERNLNNTYEFLYEMLALYIKTGSVRLNPLPEYAGYGRQVGWKKEHKSFERYLRLRPEYRDEGFRKNVTEQLARELTSMFNGILDACVGKVFVM